MNITKEMILTSLRPNVEAWGQFGEPTEADIAKERIRLDKNVDETEKKRLRRLAHPVDVGLLAELVEDITNRLIALERKVK